ncbi:hypothetical protein JCM3774_004035 [Rhodotorula dairenensis]
MQGSSSDDEIEILAPPHRRSPPWSDAPSSQPQLDCLSSSAPVPARNLPPPTKGAQPLLLLSDDTDDDEPEPLFRASSTRPRHVRSVEATTSMTRSRQPSIHLSTSTSEDVLAAPDDLWSTLPPTAGPSRARTNGASVPLARSVSLSTAAASTSKKPYESPQLQRAHTLALMHEIDRFEASSSFSSSPFGAQPKPLRLPSNLPGSSSPALPNMPYSSDDPFADLRTPKPKAVPPPPPPPAAAAAARRPEPAAKRVDKGYDPWADILESSTKKAKATKSTTAAGKSKRKGKEQGASVVGEDGRKRSLSVAASEEPEASTAGAKRAKGSEAGLSKTALKRLETADRIKLREANTLRAGDKKVSTAELTMHITGTAFRPHDGEGSDVADAGGGKKNGHKKVTKKSSPWLEISHEVQKRLQAYDCDVVVESGPEGPRGGGDGPGVDCEGAVRWTRVCDRMWSEDRKMYVPLVGNERIIVEEDSRLIFL